MTRSHFGHFGGRYVPDTLFSALESLEATYRTVASTPEFKAQYSKLLKDYVGRPTPLFFAERISAEIGAKIYLKREDLNHTGAHKINNALGQALLAQSMGKRRIIAETGAGQHGVATATACALMGMECVVYMGEEDIKRQSLNVYRMKLLGATVVPVTSGSRTLKDATTEAIRDWLAVRPLTRQATAHNAPQPLFTNRFGNRRSVRGIGRLLENHLATADLLRRASPIHSATVLPLTCSTLAPIFAACRNY